MWNPFKKPQEPWIHWKEKYDEAHSRVEGLSSELREEKRITKALETVLYSYMNRKDLPRDAMERIEWLTKENLVLRTRAQGQEDEWLKEERKLFLEAVPHPLTEGIIPAETRVRNGQPA